MFGGMAASIKNIIGDKSETKEEDKKNKE
jgi:hypothetical protein